MSFIRFLSSPPFFCGVRVARSFADDDDDGCQVMAIPHTTLWFSLVSSINKFDYDDVTEILLKVALINITHPDPTRQG
jgi:hypothetical protein